jgi:hypothetical protein
MTRRNGVKRSGKSSRDGLDNGRRQWRATKKARQYNAPGLRGTAVEVEEGLTPAEL